MAFAWGTCHGGSGVTTVEVGQLVSLNGQPGVPRQNTAAGRNAYAAIMAGRASNRTALGRWVRDEVAATPGAQDPRPNQ